MNNKISIPKIEKMLTELNVYVAEIAHNEKGNIEIILNGSINNLPYNFCAKFDSLLTNNNIKGYVDLKSYDTLIIYLQ